MSKKRIQKRPRTRPLSKNNKRNKVQVNGVQIAHPFIVAIIITALVSFAKFEIILFFFSPNCKSPTPGDTGAKIVYDAINFYHSVNENPSYKARFLELVSDTVLWYRKPAKIKTSIHFKSVYDVYCFSESPKYSDSDEINRNYKFTVSGFHRYRDDETSKLVEIENLYVEIKNGKISTLIPSLSSRLEGKAAAWLNGLNEYFPFFLFALVFVLVFPIFNISKIPSELLTKGWELLLRILRIT